MRIAGDVTALIGGTPLVALDRFAAARGLGARLLAKVEAANPGGSAKDRVALAMLDDAQARGLIAPGATLVEPTSGNTGVGLALVAAVRGYRVILTMPESMSLERRRLLAAFGAELVLTPAAEGMAGAVAKAEALRREIPGSWTPGQFDNPANPLAHERTTGPEIWRDTDGELAAFVACVGTGGAVSGAGRYLKRQDPSVRVIAVEPAASPLLSEGRAGAHGIQGIGANFVPATLERSVLDEVLTVTDEEAFAAARALARRGGAARGHLLRRGGGGRGARGAAAGGSRGGAWSRCCPIRASGIFPQICLRRRNGMYEIDARGKACPLPVVLAKKALDAGERDVTVLGGQRRRGGEPAPPGGGQRPRRPSRPRARTGLPSRSPAGTAPPVPRRNAPAPRPRPPAHRLRCSSGARASAAAMRSWGATSCACFSSPWPRAIPCPRASCS